MLLENRYMKTVVKIITLDRNGDPINLSTGSFYNPEFYGNPYTKFIITSKHSLLNDDIKNIKIKYLDNNYLVSEAILELNEFKIFEIPDCDIAILYFNKFINGHLGEDNIKKSVIYTKNLYAPALFLNTLCVPGFYDYDIDYPISEIAPIVSVYNDHIFYLKSKYIIEGYSGAPVFITYNNRDGSFSSSLIGIISRRLDNDNIEAISAENILAMNEQLLKTVSRNPFNSSVFSRIRV